MSTHRFAYHHDVVARFPSVAGGVIHAVGLLPADYASMGFASGQTIRLVVREYCAGMVKGVAQGLFPEIVLRLK